MESKKKIVNSKFSIANKDDELIKLVEKTDKKVLAVWAIDCAKRVLSYFEKEFPNNNRPRKALETLQKWIDTGIFKMTEIRKASLDSHVAARSALPKSLTKEGAVGEDNSARSAARACGQAVATAHVARHAYGSAIYAQQAVFRASDPSDAEKSAKKERDWQYKHLLKLKGAYMKKDIRKIVEEGYNKGNYAKKFRADSNPNDMEKYFLDSFIKQIRKEAIILDLGCGIGVPFDHYLIKNGIKITGIDIADKHISLAQQNVPQAQFIKGDFSKYNFGTEKFDGIISFYAIFHIPREEHRDLFLKMFNLLNKDGVILITLGTSGSEYGEEKDWCGTPMAWSTYKPEEYKKIITEIGFKIIEEKFEGQPGDDEFHYWIMAKKI